MQSSTTRNEQPSSLEQPTSGETRVAAVWQLLRPLGLCHDLLTPHTVTVYLLPVLVCFLINPIYYLAGLKIKFVSELPDKLHLTNKFNIMTVFVLEISNLSIR